MNLTTKQFENRIENAKDKDELREILKELPRVTLDMRVRELADKYGTTVGKIQLNVSLGKSQFYGILNGTKTPKKPHIIQIGFALKATLEEINELLKLARLKELYAKSKEDAIIIFGLKNNLTVEEIDELLREKGIDFQIFGED